MRGHTDTQDGLTVLDPRFPIRMDGAPIFDRMIADWPDRPTVLGAVRRAIHRDLFERERFITAHAAETQPFRAITAQPVPYHELAPEELAHEDETAGTVTAVWELAEDGDGED